MKEDLYSLKSECLYICLFRGFQKRNSKLSIKTMRFQKLYLSLYPFFMSQRTIKMLQFMKEIRRSFLCKRSSKICHIGIQKYLTQLNW
jgi:hypothetical protein